MVKEALLFLAEGFEEIEAVTCVDLLRRAGIKITIAGVTSLVVKGSRKLKIETDKELRQISGGYDAFLLPGGMPGAENIFSSQRAVNLIKEAAQKRKLIAAICASPAIVLAPLGLLDQKKATCYPGMEKKFSKSTIYQNKEVVTDENIITGQGPAAAFRFALAIIENLRNKEISRKVGEACLYTTGK